MSSGRLAEVSKALKDIFSKYAASPSLCVQLTAALSCGGMPGFKNTPSRAHARSWMAIEVPKTMS